MKPKFEIGDLVTTDAHPSTHLLIIDIELFQFPDSVKEFKYKILFQNKIYFVFENDFKTYSYYKLNQ